MIGSKLVEGVVVGVVFFLGKVVTILQKSPDAVPQIAVGAEYKKSYGRLKKVLAP